ncbi:MAG: tetratricopeptide repeat protein [Planctomycetes bacterium]|nr:tetratricopeptide repeat protein [Planctomycetota bacterium]
MRFDPQAGFEKEQGPVPILGPKPPKTLGRSPLKTAMVIVVIGLAVGAAIWFLGDDGAMRKHARADTPGATGLGDSVIRYAEAVLQGETEEQRIAAVTGTTIKQQLGTYGQRHEVLKARAEFANGKTAMGMGNDKQAVRHFRAAIKSDPGYAEAHYRLGLAYVKLGNRTAARREHAVLRNLDDDLANLLRHLVDN